MTNPRTHGRHIVDEVGRLPDRPEVRATTDPMTPSNAKDDAVEAVARLLEHCEAYADFIRNFVKADDFELHPYQPALDEDIVQGRAAIEAMRAAHVTAQEDDEVCRLREAVEYAAMVFNDYAAMHHLKNTPEGYAKDERNVAHRDMMRTALNITAQQKGGDLG